MLPKIYLHHITCIKILLSNKFHWLHAFWSLNLITVSPFQYDELLIDQVDNSVKSLSYVLFQLVWKKHICDYVS